jgi:DNA sulfur modification protein DndC
MTARELDLFSGGYRMPVGEACEITLASLRSYAPSHDHWAIAWSGGKDSSATLTLIVSLIESGQLQEAVRAKWRELGEPGRQVRR